MLYKYLQGIFPTQESNPSLVELSLVGSLPLAAPGKPHVETDTPAKFCAWAAELRGRLSHTASDYGHPAEAVQVWGVLSPLILSFFLLPTPQYFMLPSSHFLHPKPEVTQRLHWHLSGVH